MLTIIFAGLLAAGGGCGGKSQSMQSKINTWMVSTQADVPLGVYRVEPPDVITVSAPRIPELNGQNRTIGSDGNVSFNLIGPIHVAQKTTDEIAADLANRLKKYYDRGALDISVRVLDFRSKAVYVFGQVGAPGAKPYTGRDSVLKVLAEARFNDNSWPERVIVVRPHDDPTVKQKVTVDVRKMFESGDLSQDVLLEEGDLVYVPPNPLARFTIAVNKILAPIRPTAALAGRVATGGAGGI